MPDIVSLRGEVCAHQTSLTVPLCFIKCLYQARKVSSHKYVFEVSMFRLDFGTVPIVWYFLFFTLLSIKKKFIGTQTEVKTRYDTTLEPKSSMIHSNVAYRTTKSNGEN